jgi:hypothetical protein
MHCQRWHYMLSSMTGAIIKALCLCLAGIAVAAAAAARQQTLQINDVTRN